MNYTQIINKLIGDIRPVGESYEDSRRLNHLEDLIKIMDDFMIFLVDISREKERHEASIKKIGETAHKYLCETKYFLIEATQ